MLFVFRVTWRTCGDTLEFPLTDRMFANAYVNLQDSTGCGGKELLKMFFLLQINVAGL